MKPIVENEMKNLKGVDDSALDDKSYLLDKFVTSLIAILSVAISGLVGVITYDALRSINLIISALISISVFFVIFILMANSIFAIFAKYVEVKKSKV